MQRDNVREKRVLDEIIEFSESDCMDLRKIVEHIESKDVPADMSLPWEMQIKQLTSKSPNGYRWIPRYTASTKAIHIIFNNKFDLYA